MYGLRLRDASLSSAVPYLNTFLGSMKQQFILPGHFEAQYLRVTGMGIAVWSSAHRVSSVLGRAQGTGAMKRQNLSS